MATQGTGGGGGGGLDAYLTLYEQTAVARAEQTGDPAHATHLTAHARAHLRAGGHAACGRTEVDQEEAPTNMATTVSRTAATAAPAPARLSSSRTSAVVRTTAAASGTKGYQAAKAALLSKPTTAGAVARKAAAAPLLVRAEKGFSRRASNAPLKRSASSTAPSTAHTPTPHHQHTHEPHDEGSLDLADAKSLSPPSALSHSTPEQPIAPSQRTHNTARSSRVFGDNVHSASPSELVSPFSPAPSRSHYRQQQHQQDERPTRPPQQQQHQQQQFQQQQSQARPQRQQQQYQHQQSPQQLASYPTYSPARVANGHEIPYGSDYVPRRSPQPVEHQLFNPAEEWDISERVPERMFSPMRPAVSALAFAGGRPLPIPDAPTLVSPLSNQWMAALRARSQRMLSLQTAVSVSSPGLSPGKHHVPPTPFSPMAATTERPQRDARGSLLLSPMLVARGLSLTSTPGTPSLAGSRIISPLATTHAPAASGKASGVQHNSHPSAPAASQFRELLSEFRAGWNEIQASASGVYLGGGGSTSLDLPTLPIPSAATATPRRHEHEQKYPTSPRLHAFTSIATSPMAAQQRTHQCCCCSRTHYAPDEQKTCARCSHPLSQQPLQDVPPRLSPLHSPPLRSPIRSPIRSPAHAASRASAGECTCSAQHGSASGQHDPSCPLCSHGMLPESEVLTSARKRASIQTELNAQKAAALAEKRDQAFASIRRDMQTSPVREASRSPSPATYFPASSTPELTASSSSRHSVFMSSFASPHRSMSPQQAAPPTPVLSQQIRSTMHDVRELNARANVAAAQSPLKLLSPAPLPQTRVSASSNARTSPHEGYFPQHRVAASSTVHPRSLHASPSTAASYLQLPTPAPLPFDTVAERPYPPAQTLLHDISELTQSYVSEADRTVHKSHLHSPPLPPRPHSHLSSASSSSSSSSSFGQSRAAFLQQQATEVAALEARTRARTLHERGVAEFNHQTSQHLAHQPSHGLASFYSAAHSMSHTMPPTVHSDDISRALSASLRNIQDLRQTLSSSRDRVQQIQPQSYFHAHQPHERYPQSFHQQQHMRSYEYPGQQQPASFPHAQADSNMLNIEFSLPPSTSTNVVVAPVFMPHQQFSESDMHGGGGFGSASNSKGVFSKPGHDAYQQQRRGSIASTVSLGESPPRSQSTSPPSPPRAGAFAPRSSSVHAPVTPFTPFQASSIFARALTHMPLQHTPAVGFASRSLPMHQPPQVQPTPQQARHRAHNAETLRRVNARQ